MARHLMAVFLLGALAFAPRATSSAENQPATRRDDPATGSVRGTIRCNKPRPKQPLVVYLEREGGELERSETKTHHISQKGARFEPSFLVIVAKDSVVFVNDEDQAIDHNVYGLGSQSFDLGIFPQGDHIAQQFTTPGEIQLHCSVHKLMDAKVFVAPSNAWVEVDGDADHFTIENVPAGRYNLRTYQKAKRFRDEEKPLTVTAGAATDVDVELTR